MQLQKFQEIIKPYLSSLEISLTEGQVLQLYQDMNLVIEWNQKINLTAIIEPKEFIVKHFVDSLTIAKYIESEESIIDVGTGAGFPGIPLKVVKKESKITLLDSLNKRIKFLEEVIKELNLTKIQAIHGRIEEKAQQKEFRENFDIATSRAVAPLPILLEYMLPFVKVDGKCICMKGSNAQEEIESSKRALKILGGRIERIEEFTLPNTDMKRTIIIVKKEVKTSKGYPRKPGTPTKNPLS